MPTDTPTIFFQAIGKNIYEDGMNQSVQQLGGVFQEYRIKIVVEIDTANKQKWQYGILFWQKGIIGSV